MITAVHDQHSLILRYFVISIMPVKSGDQTTRRAKEDYSKSYKNKEIKNNVQQQKV